jgi:hypothetical protein
MNDVPANVSQDPGLPPRAIENRKVRVGQLDKLISGAFPWLIFGPVEPLNAGEISSAIATLSDGNPENRIGLIPNCETQTWEFDPAYAERAVVPAPEPLVASDLQNVESMSSAVCNLQLDRPLAISQIGRELILSWDHGLGDSYFALDVLGAISSHHFDQRPIQRLVTPNARHPVLAALGNSIRTAPIQTLGDFFITLSTLGKKLARLVRKRRLASHDKQDADHAGELVDDGLYQVVHVVSRPDYAAYVRKYRERHNLTASASALTLLWICREFENEGIDVSPEVGILVDLRRHLPPGRQTYANFIGVETVGYSPTCTEEEFGLRYAEQSRSTRPLINLACFLMAERLMPFLFRRVVESSNSAPRVDKAIVTYTDPSKAPWEQRIPWADGPRHAVGVANPASANHIAITVLAVARDEIQLTATFNPSRFEPALVRKALAAALQKPIADEA